MFEQTKTGLACWFLAIWLVTSSKGGISAVELQRRMGFGSYQTAWSWCTRSARRWSGRAAGRSPHGSRPTRRWSAVPSRASAAAVLPARRWSPARSRPAVARAVAVGSAGCGCRRWRRLGRESGRFPRRQRGTARRSRHRRLARLCRTDRAGYDHERINLGAGWGDAVLRLPAIHLVFGLAKRGSSAPITARSATNISRPISTSTSSACMGLRVSSFECRHRVPSCVEFISVAAAQPRFGARRSEGSSPSGADHRATSLYPADP